MAIHIRILSWALIFILRTWYWLFERKPFIDVKCGELTTKTIICLRKTRNEYHQLGQQKLNKMIIKIESHLLFLSLVNELTLEWVIRQGCNVYINSKENKNLWEGRKKNQGKVSPRGWMVLSLRMDLLTGRIYVSCWRAGLSGEANIDFGAPSLLKFVPWTDTIVCIEACGLGTSFPVTYQVNSP